MTLVETVYGHPYKVCGPYLYDKNRLLVIMAVGPHKRTVAYPRFLAELYLGRQLTKWETVDHIDRDPLNNDLSNLQVLGYAEHIQLDTKRRAFVNSTCVWCASTFTLTHRRVNASADKKKAGPFCSKKCSGEYSQLRGVQAIAALPLQARVEPKFLQANKQETANPLSSVTLPADSFLQNIGFAFSAKRGVRASTAAPLASTRKIAPRFSTCQKCGAQKKQTRSTQCEKCAHAGTEKITWPSDGDLAALVAAQAASRVATTLGVSDVAVRKRCKSRGIPLCDGRKVTHGKIA